MSTDVPHFMLVLWLILQDTRYLAPIIEQVAKEDSERAEWDSLVVEKKK
jgi:hypothetical protein